MMPLVAVAVSLCSFVAPPTQLGLAAATHVTTSALFGPSLPATTTSLATTTLLAAAAGTDSTAAATAMHASTAGGLVEVIFLLGIVTTFFLAEVFAIATSVHFGSNNLGFSFAPQHRSLMTSPDAGGAHRIGSPSWPSNWHEMPTASVASMEKELMAAPRGWRAGAALPSFEDLTNACHCVAQEADKTWFLCAKALSPDCIPDEDFTDYYGQPVYLCAL